MRVRLKGIHPNYKKLADGSIKHYVYAWRGGPRIERELGSPEFFALTARPSLVRPLPGTAPSVRC
jgi:hypothetical protein